MRRNRIARDLCGIAGFLGLSDSQLLKDMGQILSHRGPDDSGEYLDDGIGLANRRLSIIDVSGSKQPVHNEDGTVWAVHNGEIYNFRELRGMLERMGHKFYTNGDAEVIVHLYEERGLSFAGEMNGIFATAIWDSGKRRLVLVRDPIGVKPIYYSIQGEKIVFASEPKAILLWGELKREFDDLALHLLLNLLYVPGEMTMFRGIKKLLPGHMLVAERGKPVTVSRYWRLPTTRIEGPDYAIAKMLRKTLEDAVKRQMVSDVPIGSFLSGGLDTSTVVAIMSKISREPIQTFTMGFGEATDELADARLISEEFSTDHHDLTISPKELDAYPKAIWYADMPKMNVYPYFIAEFVRQHLKVVLSGMGGDELFGGYVSRYRYIKWIEFLERIGPVGISALKIAGRTGLRVAGDSPKMHRMSNRFQVLTLTGDRPSQYSILAGAFKDEEVATLYGNRMIQHGFAEIRDVFGPHFAEKGELTDQAMRAEFETKLPDDFLLVDDAMTMAHALEERVPLLDLELVDFAFKLPSSLKYRGAQGKYILRLAVKDLLPKRALQKPKRGFSVNVFSWFTGEMGEVARQVLPSGYLVKEGYLRDGLLREVLESKPDPSLNRFYNLLWVGLLFELWRKIYFESENLMNPTLDIERLIA